MCTLPVLGKFCRESYSSPEVVHQRLKRRGMDLVTVTDHDSIDAAEDLRGHADFFVSEEVTCRMPSGTELHAGVYDITERQHVQIQGRRDDLPSLLAYLEQERIFFSVQHAFSCLTGRRVHLDFTWFEQAFPAFEILNGQVPAESNRQAARLATQTGKAGIGGSDSHTLSSLGSVYTEVPGARDKSEFLKGLRLGRGHVCGESGGYWKLTADVFRVAAAMWREDLRTALLAPLAPLIPVATFVNYLGERYFAHKWSREFSAPQDGRGGLQSPGLRAESWEAMS
jgi:predicted metal-dependent phosphoesterase TrpH